MRIKVKEQWTKLEDLVKQQADNSFAFLANKVYPIQNTGDKNILMGEFASAPTKDDGYIITPLDIKADYRLEAGKYLYVKGYSGNCEVNLQEQED